MSDTFDVVIVGGGAAGLSAALVLGRCRRSVLLCNSGQPRNRASSEIHCLLGREGMAPTDLLRIGHLEIKRYNTVTILAERVTAITPSKNHFAISCEGEFTSTARKVLLSTGLVDEVPRLAGIEKLYGRTVHHCPYCDGFEHRDQPLAVYGVGDKGAGLALMMKQWSTDVVLLTDGPSEISPEIEARLQRHRSTSTPSELRGWKVPMMARCNLSVCAAVRLSTKCAVFHDRLPPSVGALSIIGMCSRREGRHSSRPCHRGK